MKKYFFTTLTSLLLFSCFANAMEVSLEDAQSAITKEKELISVFERDVKNYERKIQALDATKDSALIKQLRGKQASAQQGVERCKNGLAEYTSIYNKLLEEKTKSQQ